MAFNDSIRGGIKGDLLLFSAYEKRSSDLSDYASKLGLIVRVKLEGGEGAAMLVQAGQAVAKSAVNGGLCFRWTDTLAKKVGTVDVDGQVVCGFSLPGLEALVAGDYFWVIVPGLGSPVLTLIGHANVVRGNYVKPSDTGNGHVKDDPDFDFANPGMSFGQSLTTASGADVPVDIVLGYVKGKVLP